jgi:hypothetical protein
MKRQLSHRFVVGVVGVALLVAGAGVASAAVVSAKAPTDARACLNSTDSLVLSQNGTCAEGLQKISVPLSTVRGPRGPRGIRGAKGAVGPAGSPGATGSQGPAGTARAWAQVQSNGTIVSSFGVTSVTADLNSQAGFYCVHLSPSALSGAGAATVSPYFATDSTLGGTPGQFTTAEVDGVATTNVNGGCTDGVIVVTLRNVPGTTTTSGSVNFQDEPFYVIVG